MLPLLFRLTFTKPYRHAERHAHSDSYACALSAGIPDECGGELVQPDPVLRHFVKASGPWSVPGTAWARRRGSTGLHLDNRALVGEKRIHGYD